ncbi:MAG: HU family DNA-binding protein [Thermodesulfobacteriota bacterium]
MLKRELIATVARRQSDLQVKDVDRMVRLIFAAMTKVLLEGGEIELRGFGSFRRRRYASRQARNPGTGEKVSLGPRQGVLFRAAREMKERLNAR